MKALGTADRDFVKGLFGQLMAASARGADRLDGEWLFFALSLLKDVKPGDGLAAMQIAQMAAVHAAMMRISGNLGQATQPPNLDSAVRAINQLARTYTAQLEALKRYRTGNEQKVTVQNVSVTEGGQAIVGNFTQATPATAPQERANAPALTDARRPAMEVLSVPKRVAVPLEAKTNK
jgi:hypothetical protein